MKENEMIHTSRVLIVEGKYDAARLSHLTDAMILLTDGFGIYSDKKRQQLFKALAQKNGLILLTDSDAAGFRIRTYITNLVGEKNVVRAKQLFFCSTKEHFSVILSAQKKIRKEIL